MVKPIGYFCSFTPGDIGLLTEMEEAWGAQFQELNNCERLWMIVKLGEDLCTEYENNIRASVSESMERMDELQPGDKVGLIEALINQVKYSNS
ncbi:MAG: hypothetical protein FWK04_29620 [Nostoc sp. GBBB01]|nr:hypothetical protein [Nostoc sp. GBBB01]